MRNLHYLVILSCLVLGSCATNKPLPDKPVSNARSEYYNANCAHPIPSNRNPDEPFAHIMQMDPLCKDY